MVNAYLAFHLNLAFSSIPENKRKTVIDNCYWPLLKLIELTGIPAGIELTGWTLEQIQKIDPLWIEKFKSLLQAKKCELIGSGWTQLIGPLVPYEVNKWNQALGLDAYKRLLDTQPVIALVNEMAFSTSMVDIYLAAGYKGLIMDRDNILLALDIENTPLAIPSHAEGNTGNHIGILWSDSTLFQRFQRVVHEDIPFVEYLAFIDQRIKKGEFILPIYTNDAEVFNFRPGRFTTENVLKNNTEWEQIELICKILDTKVKWQSPSGILALIEATENKQIGKITSISHPIPVKKQLKYNVNRWAISGRDDLWLNTICHRIYKKYIVSGNKEVADWQQLCESWSSDFRTHITQERWEALLLKLAAFENKSEMANAKFIPATSKNESTNYHFYKILKDPEGIYWAIETSSIRIVLNIRRGLTIRSLSFKSQNFNPVIGTIGQGYFNSIVYGVDYYSGGFIMEIPAQRKKITDLEWVDPVVEVNENILVIRAAFKKEEGLIQKYIGIDLLNESVKLGYDFSAIERPLGLLRVGNLTFLEDYLSNDIEIKCFNGGNEPEVFTVDKNCEHGAAVSSLVSSTSGFGSAGGFIAIENNRKQILFFKWDPSACAAIPMFKNKTIGNKQLARLTFSLCELDDTAKAGGRLLPFEFEISTN